MPVAGVSREGGTNAGAPCPVAAILDQGELASTPPQFNLFWMPLIAILDSQPPSRGGRVSHAGKPSGITTHGCLLRTK
jgi:hypothetical protein